MTFRFLRPEEWHLLDHVWGDEQIHPTPDQYLAAVAMDEGKVVALQCIGLIPHGGPLWVDEKYRGQALWKPVNQLLEMVLSKIPGSGYYMLPSNRRAERVCEKLGLKKLPWSIFRREF